MEIGGLMSGGPSITPGKARNLAVFIDADNLCDPTALDHVLTDVRQRVERVLYKRAYGRPESLRAIESVLWRHGVRPVANMIVNKVTTDSALVIDAVEAICTNSIGANPIDAIAICSGDADFVPLATWLRERGCQVWCFSLADRIFANPESFYDDVVLIELVATPSTAPALVAVPQVRPQPQPTPPIKDLASAKEITLDRTQQVLKAFPALRTGLAQHLNEVVMALRQSGVLGKSDKAGVWFRQHATGFRLSPQPAPNKIIFCQTSGLKALALVAPNSKLPVPNPNVGQPSNDPVAALRKNMPLMARLQQAVKLSQDELGWAVVSVIRLHLGGKTAFDVKAYGFATLTKLLTAAQIFELRNAGTPNVAARLIPTTTSKIVATAPDASKVVTWPSHNSRRSAAPLSIHFHALRAALLQVSVQRVRREDVLLAVPELIFGTPCALAAVAGRLRDKGLLLQSQSALRIFERHPNSFVVDLSRHPQSVRHVESIIP